MSILAQPPWHTASPQFVLVGAGVGQLEVLRLLTSDVTYSTSKEGGIIKSGGSQQLHGSATAVKPHRCSSPELSRRGESQSPAISGRAIEERLGRCGSGVGKQLRAGTEATGNAAPRGARGRPGVVGGTVGSPVQT